MADAAYEILTKDSQLFTGNFVIDEQILRESGVTDFSKYREDPSTPDDELFLDFYLD
jgi:citronellol/citronellal dehydrogenase